MSTPDLEMTIRRLIGRQAGSSLARVPLTAHLTDDLDLDALDVLELILAVERRFGLVIPDSVPLHTPADFVAFLRSQSASSRPDTPLPGAPIRHT